MHIAAFHPPRVAPSESPLRVAVVGAGVMGSRHARVLASRPERFRLVGVADVNAEAARGVAEAYGAAVATRELDAIEGADAVVVATPIRAHGASVRLALARGLHVLVEKPIAASARESAELVALSDAWGGRLFVGHSERFNPVVRALARLVEPGSVRALELRRIGARAEPGAATREGALVNLGVHDFDLAAYLTRSELVLTCARGELGEGGADERASVELRAASGATVRVVVDQRPSRGERRRTLLLSTQTHVWLGDLLAPSLLRACRATGAREAIPLDTEEPLLAQALAFGASARGAGSTEIATALDGMRALLTAERAGRALRA